MKTVALVLSVAVVAWAAPQGVYQPPNQYVDPVPQYYEDQAQYDFNWAINDEYSGNYYGHQEQRNGYNTQGRYYVRLPDTRLMTVEYTVDENGYHPIITYEGQAQHPDTYGQGYPAPPNPGPAYVQPTPFYSPGSF